MEDMLWRFPHIGEQIFKKLFNKNLAKSKKVAKTWICFITNQRFYKQRVKYEMIQKQKGVKGKTHLHTVARTGNLSECKAIIENVEDNNPMDNNRWTPLHSAANNGHYEVCKLIVNSVENKNPRDNLRTTPLHLAAKRGYLSICQLIGNNIVDKNPKDLIGKTPLDYATRNGHQKIADFIKSKIGI